MASSRRSRSLNCLIPINERKDKVKQKSGQKSRSKIIAKNPEKRKLTNRLTNERSLSVTNGWTAFVKTNVRMNVRNLTEPKKTEPNRKPVYIIKNTCIIFTNPITLSLFAASLPFFLGVAFIKLMKMSDCLCFRLYMFYKIYKMIIAPCNCFIICLKFCYVKWFHTTIKMD